MPKRGRKMAWADDLAVIPTKPALNRAKDLLQFLFPEFSEKKS
jgi:hypothetical protein